jgi:hypothetical protein
VINQVPEQPMNIYNPYLPNLSDNPVLAWGFRLNLDNTSNPSLNALFPMVKATVRAFDMIQNLSTLDPSFPDTVDKFIITGVRFPPLSVV